MNSRHGAPDPFRDNNRGKGVGEDEDYVDKTKREEKILRRVHASGKFIVDFAGLCSMLDSFDEKISYTQDIVVCCCW